MRYRFADAILDRRAASLERSGRLVPLEPRTFEVLCVLVERAGELVDHSTLTELVWNGVFVTPHSVTEAISQLRRALGDDARCARIIQTAHRRGYRFVADVERLPDTDAQRWRIPERLVELFGRERDVVDVVRQLKGARLVSLVGPGGVGKTQLALEAARRITPTCAHGGVLIDLAPAASQADVERLFADVFGAVERKGVSLADSIGSMLRDTDALLVLDNCERVHDIAGRLVQSILRAAAGMRVLATTQRPLSAAGEVLVRVAPLAHTGGPDGSAAPAIELFRARAAAVQPAFAKQDFDPSIVARICERLDGLPLAIELAAARMSVLSVAQILERLDTRFDLLRQPSASPADRHGTLAAVIEWSAGLLDPAEKELLEAVSVFPGGWDLEACVAVAAPAEDAAVLTHLSALVDKSLVFADTAGTVARYRLLDTVRLFAHDRLTRSSRGALVRDRMLGHYVHLTGRADREWYSGGGHVWIERLHDERGHLREALDWAVEAPERAAAALELSGNLRWFWRASGTFIEGRAVLERALAAAPPEPTVVRTRADLTLGQLAHHMLDFDAARDALDRGIGRLGGNAQSDRAWALSLKAMNAALSMRLDECDAAAREALSLTSRLDVDWLTVHARLAFGLLHAMGGDHERAVVEMSASYAAAVTAGDPFLESYSATNLGLQRVLVGDEAGARPLLISALRLSTRLRNRRAAAGCFEGYAYVAAAGKPALAARLMGAAARIRELTGCALLPQWVDAHESRWLRVQSDLGEELASLEWHRGEAMSVDELTAMLVS